MDCMDLLKSIDDNSVNLIVTSPIYNIGIDYDVTNDRIPWKEYLDWCNNWLEECKRILTPDGKICINHYICADKCGTEENPQFPLMDLRNIQKNIGLNPHKLVVWEDRTVSKLTAWGSWMSASSPYINTPYEGILISYKDQWKRINKGKSTISKEEFIEGVSGVWKIKPETKSLTKASFPVKLPELCIKLLTYENDLVVDMFSGSGTTAIAAMKTNRNYICGDISKKYCNISEKRIKEYKKELKNSEQYKLFFGE